MIKYVLSILSPNPVTTWLIEWIFNTTLETQTKNIITTNINKYLKSLTNKITNGIPKPKACIEIFHLFVIRKPIAELIK